MIIKKRNQKLGEEKKIKQEPLEQEALVDVVEPPEVEVVSQVEVSDESEPEIVEKEPEIDLFDIENIDFTQRQERRRGSRRRGYRRIDD